MGTMTIVESDSSWSAPRVRETPIGAIIRFEAGGRQRTLWCLTGHGYMCANEQVLRAGLGQADRVDNVSVTWPDGSVEQLGSLEANRQYTIVEGESQAVVTSSYE